MHRNLFSPAPPYACTETSLAATLCHACGTHISRLTSQPTFHVWLAKPAHSFPVLQCPAWILQVPPYPFCDALNGSRSYTKTINYGASIFSKGGNPFFPQNTPAHDNVPPWKRFWVKDPCPHCGLDCEESNPTFLCAAPAALCCYEKMDL